MDEDEEEEEEAAVSCVLRRCLLGAPPPPPPPPPLRLLMAGCFECVWLSVPETPTTLTKLASYLCVKMREGGRGRIVSGVIMRARTRMRDVKRGRRHTTGIAHDRHTSRKRTIISTSAARSKYTEISTCVLCVLVVLPRGIEEIALGERVTPPSRQPRAASTTPQISRFSREFAHFPWDAGIALAVGFKLR